MTECPECGFEDASEFFPTNPKFVNSKELRRNEIEGYAWKCPRCKTLF